jgi:hypothetical protein
MSLKTLEDMFALDETAAKVEAESVKHAFRQRPSQ